MAEDFEATCVLIFIGTLEVCAGVGLFLLGRFIASWV